MTFGFPMIDGLRGSQHKIWEVMGMGGLTDMQDPGRFLNVPADSEWARSRESFISDPYMDVTAKPDRNGDKRCEVKAGPFHI